MRTATLTRQPSTDEGTFGTLTTDSGLSVRTGELPWEDNATGVSCIPPGVYTARWSWSTSHGGSLYHLVDVPMRSSVEIHSGNLCGDTTKGFASDVRGCVLPGMGVGVFHAGAVVGKHTLAKDQMGVTQSMAALSVLEADMRDEKGNQVDFKLTVQEA